MRRFKSVRAVRSATLEELSEVVGNSRAKAIIDYFGDKA